MPPAEMLDTPLLTVTMATLTVLISVLPTSAIHFNLSLRKPLADLRINLKSFFANAIDMPVFLFIGRF